MILSLSSACAGNSCWKGRLPEPWQVRHGDSIWQIERYTLQLADSLRNRRWQDAERDAVFAAHYAADLTQPLHTTRNYDGQLTGQSGVHARFESELVNALADGWRLEPRPADCGAGSAGADLQRVDREFLLPGGGPGGRSHGGRAPELP